MKISKMALIVASLLAINSIHPMSSMSFADMKKKIQQKWDTMTAKVKALIGSTNANAIAEKAAAMVASTDIKGLAAQAKKYADMAMDAKKGIVTDEMMKTLPKFASLSREEQLKFAQDVAARVARYLADKVFAKSAGKSDAASVDAQATATIANKIADTAAQ